MADTPTPAPPIAPLLQARDAARILSISERGLWSLAKSGKLKSVRIGRLVRFDVQDLAAFIQAAKSGGPPQ